MHKNRQITLRGWIASLLQAVPLACLAACTATPVEPDAPMDVSSRPRYEASWQSLAQRPLPAWFEDAKLGIFIHWGPYSVPAWSPRGTYAEWYQYWVESESLSGNGYFRGDEVTRYHRRTYGKDFDYYRFADRFTADLFDPAQWAQLFRDAGARYVVLTSKHHDGFSLWPSAESDATWGRAWNSASTAAGRDLVGELSEAVKARELKMGLYYSLYEWYNPLWLSDREDYVSDHFHPQFKDLVTRYEPELVWADGAWEMRSEDWRTPELLAWLVNDSPVAQTVAFNDRWGKETWKSEGFAGYMTTEFDVAGADRPWEECRGMGFSFGYNRNEPLEDYAQAQTLVLVLVDIVSRGGNLLLNIGPDHRGQIPLIMQDRLRQMGLWLAANGEAIYGTRRWHAASQWSAQGRRDYRHGGHYIGNDYIRKLTLEPEPGYGVKEVFFTRRDSGDETTLYAVLPRWPGASLVLAGVEARPGAEATLLANGQALGWEQSGDDLVIALPASAPELEAPALHFAYAISIKGVVAK